MCGRKGANFVVNVPQALVVKRSFTAPCRILSVGEHRRRLSVELPCLRQRYRHGHICPPAQRSDHVVGFRCRSVKVQRFL